MSEPFRLFWNEKKNTALVCFTDKPDKDRHYSRSTESKNKNGSSGWRINIAFVLQRFHVQFTACHLIPVWDGEKKELLLDLGPALRESKNPMREVKALR